MEKEKTNEKSQGLSKVLGPMHIWALGVEIGRASCRERV